MMFVCNYKIFWHCVEKFMLLHAMCAFDPYIEPCMLGISIASLMIDGVHFDHDATAACHHHRVSTSRMPACTWRLGLAASFSPPHTQTRSRMLTFP
mmetsp:Transcript_20960/g.40619  ORF Transcript_20960/g.40619 Transcript_20960/m.40619 type:complete len:96 (-) Transcript_20960:906-1193(-)